MSLFAGERAEGKASSGLRVVGLALWDVGGRGAGLWAALGGEKREGSVSPG